MDWLEVSVVVDGEGAEAVAEALRPFAHEGGVVLEQRGDPNSADRPAIPARDWSLHLRQSTKVGGLKR